MAPLRALLLLLALARGSPGQTPSLTCGQVPGALAQIDAGNGQVFGVDAAGGVFAVYNDSLLQIHGNFSHVTVGAAGVWGVNKTGHVFKMVGGEWIRTSGSLHQIDSSGAQLLTGVNWKKEYFCLDSKAAMAVKDDANLSWVKHMGNMNYFSCGPLGCWGVSDDVWFQYPSTPQSCNGAKWAMVSGKLTEIEVGSDGSVYGVNRDGELLQRVGINTSSPTGTHWKQLTFQSEKFRHVTYDLDQLWLITIENKILKCIN
ncbi:fish-egg lectin-like [Ambystoma mexicanum]|uniref:fish-egg lectin-like n=1 Tax=Ambystoma mexicanum TaxID=8296 RepID=UPI0037E79AA8